jgi:hypothetical protein
VTEASEEQIAKLQRDVRSSGDAVRCIRTAFFIFAAISWAGFAYELVTSGPREDNDVLHALLVTGWFVMLAIGFAAVVPHLERIKLRGLLAALQPSQQAQVLLPLRAAARGDARKITNSLLRELRVPTEPVPANAPTGRGDEPTPTE